MLTIREASDDDADAIWGIFHTVVAHGDTYVFEPDTPRQEALAYWFTPTTRTYVAESNSKVVGTYILRPNRPGLGSHIANAAFMVSPDGAGWESVTPWVSIASPRRGSWDIARCSSIS